MPSHELGMLSAIGCVAKDSLNKRELHVGFSPEISQRRKQSATISATAFSESA